MEAATVEEDGDAGYPLLQSASFPYDYNYYGVCVCTEKVFN